MIYNTINTWDYMKLLWTKRIIMRSKLSSIYQKYDWRYYINFLISEYLYFNRQIHAHDWWNKNAIDGFSRFFKSIYLKYLKYLQSEREYELSISNKMWQRVFISGGGIIYFHIFSLSVTYLIYILFFLVYGNYPLTSKKGRCRNLL